MGLKLDDFGMERHIDEACGIEHAQYLAISDDNFQANPIQR